MDVQDILDRAAIEPFKASTEFILSSSENLRSTLPRYRQRRETFRFIHIDASHGFQETFAELKIAEELLGTSGIVAMDDFANLHYSQNIAAIFKYLFTTPSQLTPVVVTDEKAYLCRARTLINLLGSCLRPDWQRCRVAAHRAFWLVRAWIPSIRPST